MKLLKVDGVEETKNKMDHYYGSIRMEKEEINSFDGLDRILAEDIYSSIDLPEFHRSTVDGYAVLSKDTFGASDSVPTFLEVAGRIEMGQSTDLRVDSGKAVYVPTGGMIPKGADAVVMIEYVENLDEQTISVFHAVAPGDGMITKGEDIKKGDRVLSMGIKIKPQDIGALASIGIRTINVYERPKVAILSTGDEIVDPMGAVAFGQIRDINTYALSAMVKEMGGEVTYTTVVKDDYDLLKNTMNRLLDGNNLIIISGGSSVGTKDVTAKVIDSLGDPGVFIHGVAVKPGKPTIMGKVNNTALFGLPGHPVSAMVVFKVFGSFFMDRALSKKLGKELAIHGISDVNIYSSPGKETYQMVVIEEREGEYIINPIHGKSGAITSMTRAEGYIKIASNKEGIKKGERVKVNLF